YNYVPVRIDAADLTALNHDRRDGGVDDRRPLHDVSRRKPHEIVGLRQHHPFGRVVVNATHITFGTRGVGIRERLGGELRRINQPSRAEPEVDKFDAGRPERRSPTEPAFVKVFEFIDQLIKGGGSHRQGAAQRRDDLMNLAPVSKFYRPFEASSLARETLV